MSAINQAPIFSHFGWCAYIAGGKPEIQDQCQILTELLLFEIKNLYHAYSTAIRTFPKNRWTQRSTPKQLVNDIMTLKLGPNKPFCFFYKLHSFCNVILFVIPVPSSDNIFLLEPKAWLWTDHFFYLNCKASLGLDRHSGFEIVCSYYWFSCSQC